MKRKKLLAQLTLEKELLPNAVDASDPKRHPSQFRQASKRLNSVHGSLHQRKLTPMIDPQRQEFITDPSKIF